MKVMQKMVAVILGILFLLIGQAKMASADYAIGPDDSLRITVYGYDDIKTETRVSADGRITFPLVGEVQVAGKSTFEVERELASLLIKGGFILDPQVTVMVMDYKSQQVSVLGQVGKPGRYALESASTLVDLIAMAGGITPLGDDKALIARKNAAGEVTKQEIDLRQMLESSEKAQLFAMQQGDIVYVPKAPMFYIYGEVLKPGSYRIEPKLSVAQALSLGGGLTPRGTERGIMVKRSDKNGKITEIDVELSDTVQKDDVILVDERWF
ncbi:MAG: polysaccharide export protein EpsE [Methyloglobulus sp.]|nr:polysaccharide export protein EpsE [Methyloglobulus sp.]